MPALSNPRHEAFAQAIFAGLAGETRVDRAQSRAYLTAYPNCSNGNSAEAAASRLLRNAKPILDRVRELQAEANARPAIQNRPIKGTSRTSPRQSLSHRRRTRKCKRHGRF